MRIILAMVSDILGNRTAQEAVLARLCASLPHPTSSSTAAIWPTMAQNPVEICGPDSRSGVARCNRKHRRDADQPHDANRVRKPIAPAQNSVRDSRGNGYPHPSRAEETIASSELRGLPRIQIRGPLALVHASPVSPWRAPTHTAGADELESVYAPLDQPVNVYGHIHHSFVRNTAKENCRQLRQR